MTWFLLQTSRKKSFGCGSPESHLGPAAWRSLQRKMCSCKLLHPQHLYSLKGGLIRKFEAPSDVLALGWRELKIVACNCCIPKSDRFHMTSHPTLVLQSPSRLVFLPRVVHTPGKLTGQTDKVLKCGGNPASHGYSILQSILPNSRALQHAIVVLVSTLHQGHGALLWVGTTKH